MDANKNEFIPLIKMDVNGIKESPESFHGSSEQLEQKPAIRQREQGEGWLIRAIEEELSIREVDEKSVGKQQLNHSHSGGGGGNNTIIENSLNLIADSKTKLPIKGLLLSNEGTTTTTMMHPQQNAEKSEELKQSLNGEQRMRERNFPNLVLMQERKQSTTSSPYMMQHQHQKDARNNSIGSASDLRDQNEFLGRTDSKSSGNFLDIPNHNAMGRSLSIRRVSEISHIKELRDEISGLEHLGSEFYEVRREDPDKISLDTIHKTVFKRCAHKYQSPARSPVHNKLFVILTSALTLLGITFCFWYRNFGPGIDILSKKDH